MNRFNLQSRMTLRGLISRGVPITDVEWEYFEGNLDFTQPTFIAQAGSKGIKFDISKVLYLVKDGHLLEFSLDNAAEYLREFERMHLRDGVIMQLRALKSGFDSIVSQEQVAVPTQYATGKFESISPAAASSLMHPRCSGVGLRLISWSLFRSQLNAKIPNSVDLFIIHQN